MIRVASLWPVSIGAVLVDDGALRLSLVVKVGYTLPDTMRARAEILSDPVPFFAETPHAGPEGATLDEIACAADLVPRKARADLVIVGSAHSAQPTTRIPLRVNVGGLSRSLVACASEPVTSIPLLSPYLRTEDGSQTAVVGPTRPSGMRLRRPRPSIGAEAAWAPQILDLPVGERGAGFQCAPPEQQMQGKWDPGCEVFLQGLGGPGGQRWFWLPSLRPSAIAFRGGAVESLELHGDTMILDVDACVVSVVHRGVLDLSSGGRGDLDVLVDVGRADSPSSWLAARRNDAHPVDYAIPGLRGEVEWVTRPTLPGTADALPQASSRTLVTRKSEPGPDGPDGLDGLDGREDSRAIVTIRGGAVEAALPFAPVSYPSPPTRPLGPPPIRGSDTLPDPETRDDAPLPSTIIDVDHHALGSALPFDVTGDDPDPPTWAPAREDATTAAPRVTLLDDASLSDAERKVVTTIGMEGVRSPVAPAPTLPFEGSSRPRSAAPRASWVGAHRPLPSPVSLPSPLYPSSPDDESMGSGTVNLSSNSPVVRDLRLAMSTAAARAESTGMPFTLPDAASPRAPEALPSRPDASKGSSRVPPALHVPLLQRVEPAPSPLEPTRVPISPWAGGAPPAAGSIAVPVEVPIASALPGDRAYPSRSTAASTRSALLSSDEVDAGDDEYVPPRGPLSLEEYAAVRVALAQAPDAPRATLLRPFGLDVVGWALEAARWAKRLDADASRGETKRIDELVSTIRQRLNDRGAKSDER